MEEGSEETVRARGEEDRVATVSSGHDRTLSLTLSRQLWLPTQDQNSQHSRLEEGGAHKRLPLTEELWTADSGGEIVVFACGCGPW